MAVSSIGSLGAYGPAGRLGLVVGRQTVAKTGEGEEIVALRIRPVAPLRPEVPTAAKTPDRLRPGEKAAVDRLRQRDAQVRQEEQAHAGAAGDLAGAIEYIYRTGPDGRSYAVGGSVPLRARWFSGDPAEAARLGARIAAAAQAATNPSAADLAAARQGYRLAASGADPDDPKTRPGRTLDLQA